MSEMRWGGYDEVEFCWFVITFPLFPRTIHARSWPALIVSRPPSDLSAVLHPLCVFHVSYPPSAVCHLCPAGSQQLLPVRRTPVFYRLGVRLHFPHHTNAAHSFFQFSTLNLKLFSLFPLQLPNWLFWEAVRDSHDGSKSGDASPASTPLPHPASVPGWSVLCKCPAIPQSEWIISVSNLSVSVPSLFFLCYFYRYIWASLWCLSSLLFTQSTSTSTAEGWPNRECNEVINNEGSAKRCVHSP